ncbi:basic amino acid ABC transporter substrate-binding protein [Aneurinibacillus terranovensis]|uniref:basic amino acid ABC transporter substrate-binding protein n=1 Tax=Aneurinibacillus terranovensis TaxID=278991 RepID=UPI000407FD3A|nr:basic amino acid ABC transporter substrate-binding protein [Aneurinibacillus terranovensis]
MRKGLLFILVLVLTAGLTACGAKPDIPASSSSGSSSGNSTKDSTTQGNTLDAIKKAGKITIAVDDTFPPMEFRNDKNELVGFDVDLAKAITKQIGVEANFVPTAWDGILPGLDAKKYDVIMSSMNITDERKQKVNFAEYLKLGQIVVVKAGNPKGIKSVQDLKGKVVGVQMGTTSETAVRKIAGIKDIKTYNGYTDAFNDMGLGRLDAIVAAEAVGRYYMKTKPGVYEVVGDTFQSLPVGIAVRKGDKDLLDALNKAVEEVKKNGEYAKVSKQWFGTDKSNE